MKRYSFGLLLLPWLLLGEDKPQDKPQLPDAPGKDVTQRICAKCHGAELMIGHPHSEEGWSAVVADMVQRGAEGTDDELYQVVQYLTRNIKAAPKINVNKADVKALQLGLGLTAKEAEALVAAREKTEFKSIEDLQKVPGIDPAKIQARKSLLAF